MKFQIDERDFGQGVKGLEDGQMGPSASSFLISGNCLGHNITIMSLTPRLKHFSELYHENTSLRRQTYPFLSKR
ncbi:MAG: hypothetical protein J7J52_03490, partial [Deltaproteobacteria bacterium]|nr:hypothetical protein [Deltaproteobacteria bacterium]